MIFKFEQIDGYHQRAKVPGGWLVKAFEEVYHMPNEISGGGGGMDWYISMTFIPDRDNTWVIDQPPEVPANDPIPA